MEIHFTFPGMKELLESMTLTVQQACLIENVWKRSPSPLMSFEMAVIKPQLTFKH